MNLWGAREKYYYLIVIVHMEAYHLLIFFVLWAHLKDKFSHKYCGIFR